MRVNFTGKWQGIVGVCQTCTLVEEKCKIVWTMRRGTKPRPRRKKNAAEWMNEWPKVMMGEGEEGKLDECVRIWLEKFYDGQLNSPHIHRLLATIKCHKMLWEIFGLWWWGSENIYLTPVLRCQRVPQKKCTRIVGMANRWNWRRWTRRFWHVFIYSSVECAII